MRLLKTAIEIIMLRAPHRERYSEWILGESIVVLIGITLGYYFVTPALFENPILTVLLFAVVFLATFTCMVFAIRHYSAAAGASKFSYVETINILAASTIVWSLIDILAQWYYGSVGTIISNWLVAVYVVLAAYTFYAFYNALKVASRVSHKHIVYALIVGTLASIIVSALIIGVVHIVSEYLGIRIASPLCTLQTLANGTVVDSCDGTVMEAITH